MPLKNQLTLAAFIAKFSSEKACHEYLAKKRWPNGFVCPSCKGTHSWMLADGKYECSHCHKHVGVTAGTVMHRSHIPLTKWFLAFYLVMSDKRGISAVELSTSIVFFGTTRPANGFRFTKPSRPALPGGSGVVSKLHQEQRPGLCLDRYGFRILCGAPNPEQVAWGIFRFR